MNKKESDNIIATIFDLFLIEELEKDNIENNKIKEYLMTNYLKLFKLDYTFEPWALYDYKDNKLREVYKRL